MSILKKFLQHDDAQAGGEAAKLPQDTKSVKETAAVELAAPVKSGVRHLLIQPLITEKASALMSQNQYVFAVRPEANKITVAAAVQEVYQVKPVAVRLMNVSGKERVRGRIVGRKHDWKKAIVTLPEGKSIRVSEGA